MARSRQARPFSVARRGMRTTIKNNVSAFVVTATHLLAIAGQFTIADSRRD